VNGSIELKEGKHTKDRPGIILGKRKYLFTAMET
jgi:hypothetical protein